MLRLGLPWAARESIVTGPRHGLILGPTDCPIDEPTLSARLIIRTIMAVLWVMRGLCVICA
jgi:hypothetical protein